MHTTRFVLLATAAIVFLVAIPAASAVPGAFGSQVLAGESDWIIPAKGNSRPFHAVYADMGVPGDPLDDCVILRVTSSSTVTNADYTSAGTKPILNKDLRLTPCRGLPAGTVIGDGDSVDKAATWNFDTDLHAVYADVNSNGKYDKTDYLYLTTKTVTATAANQPDGFATATSASAWTVRLTGAGSLPGGSFVRSGDPDATQWGSSAGLVFAPTASDTLDAGVMMEREDGQWLWAPSSSSTMLLKGTIPPLDSVRLNTITPSVPDIRVTGINVATPEIVAGSNFNVLADVTNAGKLAGTGLVLSKLDGTIVDARASPLLGAGEKTTMLLTVHATSPGTASLAINDLFAVIEVGGEGTAADGSTRASLEAKIAALEARLAALEAQPTTSGSDLQVQGSTQAKSPGVEPILLLVTLGALVFLVRRRGQ